MPVYFRAMPLKTRPEIPAVAAVLDLFKMPADIFFHGSKHIQFKNTFYQVPIQKLEIRLSGIMNQFIDTYFVFINGFFQELIKLCCAQGSILSNNFLIHHSRPEYPLARQPNKHGKMDQSLQSVIIWYFRETTKKTFKNIRHPIPAWAGIKSKSIFLQSSCTPAPGILRFSRTVTFHPALAIKQAADRPAKPLPITIAFFQLCENKVLDVIETRAIGYYLH